MTQKVEEMARDHPKLRIRTQNHTRPVSPARAGRRARIMVRGGEGGRLLVVLNSEVQALDRAEGEATLHGSDLIHGVSAMTSGVRYSLLLFFSKRQRPAPTKQ